MQVYAVCHSFKSFLNLIELLELGTGIKLWGEKMNVVVAISHFCITFNSSINFAIYCFKERCHSNKSPCLGNMFMYTKLVNLTKYSFLAQTGAQGVKMSLVSQSVWDIYSKDH